MGNGRKTEAPCGHPGEVVIGTYVQCLRGCHKFASDAPAIHDQCPRCKSKNVDHDYTLEPIYFHFNPNATPMNWRCWDCGHTQLVDRSS